MRWRASDDMAIDPRAIASRSVTGLSPTSTILTRPRASKWVSGTERHAEPRLLPHLLAQVVEQRGDLEPFHPKSRIVGQREPEVAGAHDRHAQLLIETENLAEMALQIAHVVADAAHAELAEVREVLANLRRIEVILLRQRLRADRADPRVLERIEAAQIHRKTVRGELRNLVCALLDRRGLRRPLVRAFHRAGRLTTQCN